ncbi:PIR Superfamily Protein [Plasmodium ovale wallikeri]|uniref:PIR Superfamily Protein n=1 Tax=Plasmodium ovale wallikeri TaxID=864142 RepID=A0A1A9AGG6_PLAOA|nr:PIR Superfamily Protein [Plasmodium ovale wallikeri]SBT58820.1 PIR Superfamily Protein [Plasmodium ovale wallikeri]
MTGGKALSTPQYYELFFKIRNIFNSNQDGHYDNFLHKTDQALRNISMYLIENYKGDYESCRIQDSGTQCKDRCKFLNIWLNEKKSIYTSNGKCTFYNKLWEDYVENLWKKIDESIENPYKCQRDLNSSGNNFPEDKFSQYCNLSPSEVSLLTCPDKAYVSSCTTVLTITYVGIGIILIYMYFSKFSNMWNRIKSIIKRKLRIGDNTDEQDNYELLRNDENETMSSINSMYNITYNTPRN